MRKVRRTGDRYRSGFGACGGTPSSSGHNNGRRPESLVLLSHESFAAGVTEETFAGFTDETGIAVEVLAAGGCGAHAQPGDPHQGSTAGRRALWGRHHLLSRALAEDLFAPHEAATLRMSPRTSEWTPRTG